MITAVVLKGNAMGVVLLMHAHSGFGFRPHVGTSKLFVPEGPKSQAGGRTGHLDLPTKCQGPFSE